MKLSLTYLLALIYCGFMLSFPLWSDIRLNGKPISSDTGGIKLDANDDGTIDVVLASDGKLGVGSVSPGANLHVSGNVYISGNITLADAMQYSGGGKPNRTLILTAAGATPAATGGAAQSRVGGTYHTYYVLDFDASTDESAYWHWIQPDSYDSGNISVTLYWMSSSTSNSVIWGVQTKGITLGEAVDDTLGSAQTATTAAQGSANTMNSTTIPAFSPGWQAGDYVVFKIFRDADTDSMSGDARLIKAKIEYAAATESD